MKGKVWFLGGGPGDPDLLTVKARRILEKADAVIFPGSLLPEAYRNICRPDASFYNSAKMTLEEILEKILAHVERGEMVARIQSGDPSIYGSLAEQAERLDEAGVEWEIVPGVSSFAAAAAALGKELTIPEEVQTVIITRAEGRTPMPPREKLENLAQHGATMVLLLSAGLIEKAVARLTPGYGEDCPAAVVYRALGPDQKIVIGTLADIAEKSRNAGIDASAVILVGRFLTARGKRSKLYDPSFSHSFRAAARKAAAK